MAGEWTVVGVPGLGAAAGPDARAARIHGGKFEVEPFPGACDAVGAANGAAAWPGATPFGAEPFWFGAAGCPFTSG